MDDIDALIMIQSSETDAELLEKLLRRAKKDGMYALAAVFEAAIKKHQVGHIEELKKGN